MMLVQVLSNMLRHVVIRITNTGRLLQMEVVCNVVIRHQHQHLLIAALAQAEVQVPVVVVVQVAVLVNLRS
jgi:hypothetical protein